MCVCCVDGRRSRSRKEQHEAGQAGRAVTAPVPVRHVNRMCLPVRALRRTPIRRTTNNRRRERTAALADGTACTRKAQRRGRRGRQQSQSGGDGQDWSRREAADGAAHRAHLSSCWNGPEVPRPRPIFGPELTERIIKTARLRKSTG
jgi:hypothetical protein